MTGMQKARMLTALLHDNNNGAAQTADLVAMGGEAVLALIEALNAPTGRARSAAARALGQIGDARAVEPLYKLIRAHDESATSAVKALGGIRDLSAVTALLRVLGWSLYNGEVTNALAALSEWSLTPLLRLLEGDDADFRERIVVSLSKIDAPEIIAPLVRCALKDKDAAVRTEAVRALKQKGKVARAPLLRALLDHRQYIVRRAADILALETDEAIAEAQTEAKALLGDGASGASNHV